MVHLTLAGMSEDKRRLVLLSDAGVEFTLDVDARLRAALRGETERLAQLEITMESSLRPREIQTRIRAGESTEEVARAANSTPERIMGFVAPVLAERAHIAERALGASLRTATGSATSGSRPLGEAVEAHLPPHLHAADIEWDAWRRADGRWTVQAAYVTEKRPEVATFAYDVRGSYIVAEDDTALRLVGAAPAEAPVRDDLRRRRARRTPQAVDALLDLGPEVSELGDDAIALVEDDGVGDAPTSAPPSDGSPAPDREPDDTPSADEESTVDLADVARELRAPDGDVSEHGEDGAQPQSPDAGGSDHPEGPAAASDAPEATDAPESPAPPPKRTARRRRASVPSWDEIMFGGNGTAD